MQPPSPRGARIGLGVIALVAIGVWAASGFYIVQEGQVAVVTQFGKYKSTSQAGFQWRLPYPIQSHETVNASQLRTFEVGFRGGARNKVLPEALMLTTDENIVDMQFVVQYRLRADGAPDYLFMTRDPDESVRQASETAMREIVGKQTMDFVLYEGRTTVASSGADAADPGSLPDRHPGQHRGHPERAAARAGAGRVRRRRQGWPGPRAPDQRRPGLRQPGRAAGQRSGLAHAGAGRGLQGQGDRRCAG